MNLHILRTCLLVCFLPTTLFAAESPWTLSVNLRGQRVEGFPIETTPEHVSLLGRDGRLIEFSPTEVSDFKKASASFRPFSAGEMRAALIRELPQLEVTGTGHYLVAHPPGTGKQWAQRFEDFYRSMVYYFSVRGFSMKQPEFPLAAIVWGKREDFLRYAAAEGANIPPGVIGYYSSITNRVTLYDLGAGSGDAESWRQNASTIVHEAAHQTAFNTGIHRRFANTPKWVIEGLGTLFESRGVWDSRTYPNRKDRVNQDRLSNFKQYQKAGRPANGYLAVVADERLFQMSPLAAYAEAWALTFYLTEEQPRKYSEYLKRMAALKPMTNYTAEQRVRDFQEVFGDQRMFEANYLRFLATLE